MKTLLSLMITLAPLVFGLAAWGFAAAGLFSRKMWCLTASWCCCGCALWFPLQAIYRWTENGDMAAILDCTHAYFLCATVLLLVNALLSILALFVKIKKPPSDEGGT